MLKHLEQNSQKRSTAAPPMVGGLRRLIYISLGTFFVGLAVLGILLPGLPATPFLLLANYFYLRSSRRLNEKLLRSRWFGPMLRDWQEHCAVRPHVKVVALTLLPLAIFASIWFGKLSLPLALLVGGFGLVGLVVVIRLPVVRKISTAVPTDATTEDRSRQASELATDPLQR